MNNTDNFSYSNLNILRKIYLSLLWLGVSLFSLGLVAKIIEDANSIEPVLIIFVVILALFTYWTHYAVTKRKITQLKWLAFLNLIPFANIIGLLIMLSILRVSKIEVETSSI